MSLRSLPRSISFVLLAIVLPPMLISCSGGKPADEVGKGDPGKTIPDNPEAIRLNKAIADYTEAIRLDPNKVNDRGELAYYKRGMAYAEKGEHDKAIADFSEANRLYPLVKAPYLRARLVEVYNARAKSYEKNADYDKAIADYTEVIQIGTGGFQDVGEVQAFGGFAGNACYRRGVCHDEKGQHDKALADYKEAIRLAPELAKNEELQKRMSK